MRLGPLLLAATFAAAGWAGSARACTDPSRSTAYFFHDPPERHGDTPMLRVRITGFYGNLVHARLDGAYGRLSPDGTVRIYLSSLPVGGSCLHMGATDGPVFVIGTLVRYHDGRLELEAISTRPGPQRGPSVTALGRQGAKRAAK